MSIEPFPHKGVHDFEMNTLKPHISLLFSSFFLCFMGTAQVFENEERAILELKTLFEESVPRTEQGRKAKNQAALEAHNLQLSQEAENSTAHRLSDYILHTDKSSNLSAIEQAHARYPEDRWISGLLLQHYGLMSSSKFEPFRQNGRFEEVHSSYYDLLWEWAKSLDLVFTNSDEDTEALLLRKASMNRIEIIPLTWIHDQNFLDQLRARGWKIPKNDPIASDFIQEFLAKNASKKIGLSPTLNKACLKGIEIPLYPYRSILSPSLAPATENLLFYQSIKERLDLETKRGITQKNQLNWIPLLHSLHANYESTELDIIIKRILKNTGNSSLNLDR